MKTTATLARLLVGAFLAIQSQTGLAAEVEAKTAGVQVFSEANNKSAVLGTMEKGESLPAIERSGMFWQVTIKDGKKGFVSVLAVKHKPDTNTALAKAIKGVAKEGRDSEDPTEGRQRSAVMGVRGLAPDDDMANAGSVRPNLRAVYRMEDSLVGEKKVQTLGESVFDEVAAAGSAEP